MKKNATKLPQLQLNIETIRALRLDGLPKVVGGGTGYSNCYCVPILTR